MAASDMAGRAHGHEKQLATVKDLVDLFSRGHIADDELLLKRTPEKAAVVLLALQRKTRRASQRAAWCFS